ncbi:MAG TPA: class I SAM-dependent methyltransferase [Bryobacteraceae bacterium]|nr:class I SAM-dependent methyltransferase [Bryobacteraceae bacterium]
MPLRAEFTRQSSALDQFFQAFHGQLGLMVLDLGVSNQENTDFFNLLGHKLRYDNFVRSLDESFGDGDFYANQENELRIEAFQAKVLNFDDDSLDGVLVWDALQYLGPAMLEAAVSQLHAILHKGGQLLTVFHTDEKLVEVPSYSYRIQDRNKVKLVARGRRRPAQYYTTRSLEKLFKDFDQVKFFLTQDSIREVIVRK